MVTATCDWCDKEYETYKAWLKKSKNHFCSRDCKHEWNKTQEGYWKDKKIPYYPRPNKDIERNKNPNWKGGKRVDKDGYILILRKRHPYCDYHGYVREHRLVYEDKLGRYLFPTEVVHHRDGDKQNNKIENLELYENGSEHQKEHYPEAEHLKHSPAWKRKQAT